tara:strand:+ start:972 stop:1256 length:285 start_codon:yes stop_codon:yes gene_type:complete
MNKINTTDFPTISNQLLENLYSSALECFCNVEDFVEEVELTNYNEARIDEAYIEEFIQTGIKFKEASNELKEYCAKTLLKRGYAPLDIKRYRDE